MKNNGFTIVESLVAVSILVAIIIGATSALRTSISSYTISKDEIIAFYLAQEGFEQVRNVRDSNGLSGQPWLQGIAQSSDPCFFGNNCTVDPTVTDLLINCGGQCPLLRQNPVTGAYGYNSSWTVTPFRRTIRLASIAVHEVSIVVTVDWSKGAVTRQFKARENLLDWQ